MFMLSCGLGKALEMQPVQLRYSDPTWHRGTQQQSSDLHTSAPGSKSPCLLSEPVCCLQYDQDVVTWSPQGRIHQIEYAMEAVKQGSAAVGLKVGALASCDRLATRVR